METALLLMALFMFCCAEGFVPRDVIYEKCALAEKKCITSGNIFKKSVVCASNGKRYLNQCALQLRACDLYFDSGEVLTEERCLWIEQDKFPNPPLDNVYPTKPKETEDNHVDTTSATATGHIQSTPRIIYDHDHTTQQKEKATHVDTTSATTTGHSQSTSRIIYDHDHTTQQKETTTHVDTTSATTTEHIQSTPLHGYPIHGYRYTTDRKEITTRADTTSATTTGHSQSTPKIIYDHEYTTQEKDKTTLTTSGAVGTTSGDNGDYSFYSSYESSDSDANEYCSCRGDGSCPSCNRVRGGPVCGTDGKTYQSRCEFDTYRCDHLDLSLRIFKEGSCTSLF